MIGEVDSFVGVIYSSDNLKDASAALHVNPDKFVVFMGTDEVWYILCVFTKCDFYLF